MTRYNGGKGGAGVYQTIINQFPPHRVYLEPFAGGANIYERKAPAASSILADADPVVVDALQRFAASAGTARPSDGVLPPLVLHMDALDLLSLYPWVGDELVYLDPPYPHSTRKRLDLYRCEMTDAQHRRLLELASSIPAMVATSGYRCAMYDDAAARYGWRRVDYTAQTRRGPVTESLWLNYPAPAVIADCSYVGRDFRERERIARKAARWRRRWEQLPPLERQVIARALASIAT